ncbi:hypothetical protein [Actinoplanes sp. NBRC 101535]|uniref:hypothetical protein n=1 Tax=Actinoplanes sp. NBRC 101535 TaxID=3032196 RepID=UPI0024A4121E|nr:hypothetical protein [Actinoplanes sp. NBRC 101535]GLY02900.1 hypothetical protein Acsp01_32790 [Actinoplanes sp. NBRC 101535]
MAGAMTAEQRQQKDTDHTRLNIWVTFAGTILAALIGGVFAIVASGGDDEPEASATTPATSRTSPRQTTTPAVGDAEPATPSSPAAAPEPGSWAGRVVVETFGLDAAAELDTRPAQKISNSGSRADVIVSIIEGRAQVGRAAFAQSSFAVWDGDGTPGAEECRLAVSSQGVATVQDLATKTVLCVRTTEYRTARLTITKIDSRQDTVSFDAVVWDQP